jgi:protease I
MKNILFIIAPQDFRDEEYFIPKNIFLENEIIVETISTKKGIAVGVLGGEVEIEKTKEEIILDDFSAIVFVGGKGAIKYLDNEDFYGLAKEAFVKKLIVAAICIAPLIFAKAGLLRGKNATVWSSDMNKSAITILKEEGAIYKKEDVVFDDPFITANGPDSAELFAKTIINKINLTKKGK